MKQEKVFVRLLDGTISWVPINSRQTDMDVYELVIDDQYLEYEHPLCIYEFYPGDIVETKWQVFGDGSSGRVANTIVKFGGWPDRKFCNFKFKATIGDIEMSKDNAVFYQEEIKRIKEETSQGQLYYPKLTETIVELEKL